MSQIASKFVTTPPITLPPSSCIASLADPDSSIIRSHTVTISTRPRASSRGASALENPWASASLQGPSSGLRLSKVRNHRPIHTHSRPLSKNFTTQEWITKSAATQQERRARERATQSVTSVSTMPSTTPEAAPKSVHQLLASAEWRSTK